MNPEDSVPGGPHDGSQPIRLPTVDEALRHTPLTSILPFEAIEAIPVPCVQSSDLSRSVLSDRDRLTSENVLKQVDIDMLNRSSGPETILRDLQNILMDHQTTNYAFKQIPLRSSRPSVQHNGTPTQANSMNNDPASSDALGPFAKAFLANADIPYGYPSPRPSEHRPHPNQSTNAMTGRSAHISSSPAQSRSSDHAQTSGGATTTSRNLPATPKKLIEPTPTPSQIIMAVVPPPSQHKNMTYPEITGEFDRESVTPTRKRKLQDFKSDLVTADERQQGEIALKDFQDLMSTIFGVDESIDFNGFGQEGSTAREFFSEPEQDGGARQLRTDILIQLDKLLTKVIATRNLSNIQIDLLIRLQRICARGLASFTNVEVGIPTDDGEDEMQTWSQNLEFADNTIRASRLMLRLMVSADGEKLLYPEELVQNLLAGVKRVLESCLCPIVERRITPDNPEPFEKQIEVLQKLLQLSGSVVKLLGDAIMKIDFSPSAIASVEFLAVSLLFVENATSEKQSVLGIHKFEAVRRHAMDVIARLFLRYSDLRRPIFDEILSSLEKLPDTRQSARQFRIENGKPIQLVSALLMQLVQMSTRESESRPGEFSFEATSASSDLSETSPASSDGEGRRKKTPRRRNTTAQSEDATVTDHLGAVARTFNAARSNASYVAKFMVERAMKATKTGDQPYRRLLDIFIEDFLNVLDFPEWPASEVLLQAILITLLQILRDEKQFAPAKNMSLDLVASIACRVAELRATLERLKDRPLLCGGKVMDMSDLVSQSLAGVDPIVDMIDQQGPYRLLLASLYDGRGDDVQRRGAMSYNFAQWARATVAARNNANDPDKAIDEKYQDRLESIHAWLESTIPSFPESIQENNLDRIETDEARILHTIILMSQPLCRALWQMLDALFKSLTGSQTTVRSQGLKSITQVLEKSPSILADRSNIILGHLLRCAEDKFQSVRDSAIALLGSCITLQPSTEPEAAKILLRKAESDSAASVRKRSMKLLKDIHARNNSQDLRADIAEAMLFGLSDIDESVRNLARQCLEDILFTSANPILKMDQDTIRYREAIRAHSTLVIVTTCRSDASSHALENFLKDMQNDEKAKPISLPVLKAMVLSMFDQIIDNEALPGGVSQQTILHTLTIFAASGPQLFDANQMKILRPYIENLATAEDILVFRSVIIIFRRVLPVLPPLEDEFLQGVQDVLFRVISKLKGPELKEVASCLWIISSHLGHTERIAKLIISVLKGIKSVAWTNAANPSSPEALKASRYVTIAGHFAMACDLESHKPAFQDAFQAPNLDSVAGLVIETLCPLTAAHLPFFVRHTAVESICLTCQSWPQNFKRPSVIAVIRAVFNERNAELQRDVLVGMQAFYGPVTIEVKTEHSDTNGDDQGATRLGESMGATERDGAATVLAQQFLSDILRIALGSIEDVAQLATEIIASVSSHGLIHPKQCIPALVALETSPNAIVSKTAFDEHKRLHEKHEGILEKEYIKAIEQAYMYQQQFSAAIRSNFEPKLALLYDVLKGGSITLRKKLFGSICARLPLNTAKPLPRLQQQTHIQFVRFVLENLSTLDYARIDELGHLVRSLEKVFSTSANIIGPTVESLLQSQEEATAMDGITVDQSKGFKRSDDLQQLAPVTLVLSMMWETRSHLYRVWSFNNLKSAPAKDNVKAPIKNPAANALTEKHIEALATMVKRIESEDGTKGQCRNFLEQLSLDSEARLNADGDEEDVMGERMQTPVRDDREGSFPTSGGSKRSQPTNDRRKSMTPAGTPSKMKCRPSLDGRRKSSGKQVKWTANDDQDGGWD